jgi:hypothetical protein
MSLNVTTNTEDAGEPEKTSSIIDLTCRSEKKGKQWKNNKKNAQNDRKKNDAQVSMSGGAGPGTAPSGNITQQDQQPRQRQIIMQPLISQAMSYPGGLGNPSFDGNEISAFLRNICRTLRSCGVSNNQEFMEAMAVYAKPAVARLIKRLPGFENEAVDWRDLQRELKKEFNSKNLEQTSRTLETIIQRM